LATPCLGELVVEFLFQAVFWLLLVTGIIALIGHGIWVVVRTLIRAVFHIESSEKGTHRHCPVCGRPTRIPNRCDACDWTLATHDRPSHQTALNITARQLSRLASKDLLDKTTYATIQEALLKAQRPPAKKDVPRSLPEALAPQERPVAAPPSSPRQEPVKPPVLEIDEEKLKQQHEKILPVAKTPPPAKPASLADRAKKYASQRQQAAAVKRAAPKPPPRRTKPLSEWLAAFMEDRNIRWGELVGGLMIVCCSIALVVSFWSEISERPFLKFFVFNGVTAALFGLGIRASRQWRLPTTGEGMLTIATLLVPLNFLAIAAFSEGSVPASAVIIAGELFSIGLFGWLVYLTGQIILSRMPLGLVAAILGPSIIELLVRRFVEPGSSAWVLHGLALTAVGCYLGVVLARARIACQTKTITLADASDLLKLFGMASFAIALPLGLLLAKSEAVVETVRLLAPSLNLLAIAALATGLLVWQRFHSVEKSILNVVGVWITLFGVGIQIGAVALSWPQPGSLLLIAIFNLLLFSFVSRFLRFPMLQVPATFWACVALTLSILGISGHIDWTATTSSALIGALFSAPCGNALLACVLFSAGSALAMLQFGGRTAARVQLLCTAPIGLCSLALVLWFGTRVAGDPYGATWVLAFYAVAAIAATRFVRDERIGWVGTLLSLAAILQAIVYALPASISVATPWVTALLIHATAAGLASMLLSRYQKDKAQALIAPLWQSALATATLAACLLGLQITSLAPAALALRLLWIAGIWLTVAWVEVMPVLFALSQLATAGSIAAWTVSRLKLNDWFNLTPQSWFDIRTYQWIGIALACFCLLWAIFRMVIGRMKTDESDPLSWKHRTRQLLLPGMPLPDQWFTGALALLVVALSVYSVVPGVCQELSPKSAVVQAATGEIFLQRVIPPASQFEIVGLDHTHALNMPTTMLWVVVLGTLLVSRWNDFRPRYLPDLVFLAALATLLVAGRWESEVAVASALRWTTAGFFLCGSALLWLRKPILEMAGRFLRPHDVAVDSQIFKPVFATLVAIVVLPLSAMGIFAILAVLDKSTLPHAATELLPASLWLSIIAGTVSAIICFWGRKTSTSTSSSNWQAQIGIPLAVLGAAPLIATGLAAVAAAFGQHPIIGPDQDSFFLRIGLAGSYASPTLVLAIALVGHALRERSSRIAFAGSLVLNIAVTAGWLLAVKGSAATPNLDRWIHLAQLNAIVSACYSVAWAAIFSWQRRSERQSQALPQLLSVNVTIASGFLIATVAAAMVHIFYRIQTAHEIAAVAGLWGWGTLAIVGSGVAYVTGRSQKLISSGSLALLLTLLTGTLACQMAPSIGQNLSSYHTMLLGMIVAASLILMSAVFSSWNVIPANIRERLSSLVDNRQAVRWTSVLATGATLLVARHFIYMPSHHRWELICLGLLSLLASATACYSARRRFLYVAAALTTGFATVGWRIAERIFVGWGLEEFIAANILGLALPAVIWLIVELRVIRPRRSSTDSRFVFGTHRLSAAVALGVTSLFIAIQFASSLGSRVQVDNLGASWLALGATILAISVCLWDNQARFALQCLYICGLLSIGLFLTEIGVAPEMTAWLGVILVGGYTIATSYLANRQPEIMAIGQRLGMPHCDRTSTELPAWLLTFNCILGLFVITSAFQHQFTLSSIAMRLAIAKAATAQGFAIGLLARGRRQAAFQQVSLVVTAIGAIAWSWAWITPNQPGDLLNRLVMTIVAFSIMATLYGIGLAKILQRENAWTRAAQTVSTWLAVAVAVCLASVLTFEVTTYMQYGEVVMAGPAISILAIAFLGVSASCLAAAILPGRDPLNLSPQWKTAYVYAAEVMLGLELLHLRLTMPWIFGGIFQQWWQLIVLAVAYLGVGLSEWMRRKGHNVLAEPLARTASVLPLASIFGVWIAPAEMSLSAMLAVTSGVYMTLAIVRRSFGYAAAATLAANAGLWVYLNQTDGFQFLQHPQLWFIPPALCILVASFLCRDRLSAEQLTAFRYLSSAFIYTSSTADVFLNGVGQQPWLPILLALFSIAGIFMGIMLRIRAFLYLGVSFLSLSMLIVIKYAAVDLHQTWLWYACGIALGAIILAVFAMFEKRRSEILQMMEQLKDWEA